MSRKSKVFVLGATGRIGAALVSKLLARGHEVTAYARSAGKISPRERLTIAAGSLDDGPSLRAAMADHDVVVSCLGPRPRDAFSSSCTLMADSAASIVAATSTAGPKRALFVSAALLFPETGLVFSFFRWFIRHHLRDLGTMEAIVGASDLDWTIARPPRLVAGVDDAFRAVKNGLPAHHRATTFAAVAAFLVEAIESGAHAREIVGLSR